MSFVNTECRHGDKRCSSSLLFVAMLLCIIIAPSPCLSVMPEDVEKCAQLDALLQLESPTAEELILRAELRILCAQDYEGALADSEAALGTIKTTGCPKGKSASLDVETTYTAHLRLAAQASLALGNLADAEAYYDLYMAVFSEDHVARWNNMVAAMHNQNWSNAESHATSLLSVEGARMYENYLVRARARKGLNNCAEARSDYLQALTDWRVPLVVHIEYAEFLLESCNASEPDRHADALAEYSTALERLREKHNGSEKAFPPEWRLRRAEIMKVTGNPRWPDEIAYAIEAIDCIQKATKPSEKLYALRAEACHVRGHSLQARSDAIRAWELYNKNIDGQNPSPPFPSTNQIIQTVLGAEHLVLQPIPTPAPTP